MMMVVNAKVSGTPVPLPIRKATGTAPPTPVSAAAAETR